MDQTQADEVAQIALSIPPNATSRDVLVALTKAYRAGIRRGVMAQANAHDAVIGAIGRILEPHA